MDTKLPEDFKEFLKLLNESKGTHYLDRMNRISRIFQVMGVA